MKARRRISPRAARLLAVAVAAGALGGCAGYNVDVGTGGAESAEFSSVYRVPATSLEPWAERVREPALPPPPASGGSGVSTLPAGAGPLPPPRPASN